MSLIQPIPLAVLLGLFVLPGGEKFAEGVKHFREGRFEKSYALLCEVEKAYGDKELPSALLVDLALSASKTGRFDEAEGYAERVAARDEGLGYLRDQVVGAARYFAARKAARDAETPAPQIPGTPTPGTPTPGTPHPGAQNPGPQGPDIKKLDEALSLVGRAIEAFGSAIMARPASLEARRNLERALELEKELEKKKKEAEDKKKKDDEKKKDDKNKDDKNKDDKNKDKKDENKKDDENKDDKKDENKKDENKEDKKQDKKDDKKGEGEEKQPEKAKPEDGKEQPLKQLSPEEKKRLEKVLEDYQKALVELKKSRAPKHQPGKKDW